MPGRVLRTKNAHPRLLLDFGNDDIIETRIFGTNVGFQPSGSVNDKDKC
jgi:hypothetical protein